MKTQRSIFMRLLLFSAVALNFQVSTLFGQGTAFTYQGRLADNGAAANGIYEMEFRLFDLASNGTQQGGTVAFALGVTNGLFTITLDFGSGIFDGSPRWLQIAVRPAGSSGAFTNLAPRQALTATPYSIVASKLNGPLPSANLTGTYANALTFNNPANSFSGNGGGLTNLNASSLIGAIANGATTATSANTPNTIVARDGFGYFSISGLNWGASALSADQGGSIELGNSLSNGTVPFIDFHYGVTSNQDYNVRLINDADGLLTARANFYVTGGLGLGGALGVDQTGQNGGSVSSNSLTFGGASGEGIASRRTPGPTQWGLDFYTGFQPRMTILNNGNIGIGSDAPGEKLQIAGNLLASGTISGNQFTGNGAGITNVNALTVNGIDSDGFWRTTGNANTIPGVHFLGTTDNQPLQLLVGGSRALFVEPHSVPNLVGGYVGNQAGGVIGAAIAGGGTNGAINRVEGDYGFIGAGQANNAGAFAVVAGGSHNSATTAYSFVGGGYGNASSDAFTTVAGGNANSSSGDYATVGGGDSNNSSGNYATVAGGSQNFSTGGSATVGGGIGNLALNESSTVAGGGYNVAMGQRAFIGGGLGNGAYGDYAMVGGGTGNLIQTNAIYATIVGGEQNKIGTNSGAGSIGGGVLNSISDNAGFSTIGGGWNNSAASLYASIGGGSDNTSIGDHATVGGGQSNTGSSYYATVAGGAQNTGSGLAAAIGGGEYNTGSQAYATVGGGFLNAATNYASTVPGGKLNSAGGSFSLAAGYRAKANHTGSFVWADSQDTADFVSTAINQFSVRAAGGVRLSDDTPSLSFGSTTRQMLNLWGSQYGVGVQSDTLYFRCGGSSANGGFAWYKGGVHQSDFGNAGGGQQLMHLFEDRLSVQASVVVDQAGLNDGTISSASLRFGPSSTEGIASRRTFGGVNQAGLDFFTASTSRMTILNNGNVGIGTVAPTARLTVIGTISSSGNLSTLSSISAGGDIAAGGSICAHNGVTCVSDRNKKAGFEQVDTRSILEKVAALSITRWHYTNDPSTPHLGAVAQDFHAAFGVGLDDKTISTVDADGVALAAIQGLNQKLEEQRAELKQKEAEITELKQAVAELKKLALRTDGEETEGTQ